MRKIEDVFDRERQLAAFASLLGPATAVHVGADELTLLRSGPGTFAQLRDLIDGAHFSVEVEVYELGRPELTEALVAAHARGVTVTVIDSSAKRLGLPSSVTRILKV